MRITFKLYASLGACLPQAHRSGNSMPLEVADGATLAQVIGPFGPPRAQVHLVPVNGHYIAPAERDARALGAGDTLANRPPIAGG
ncbi:MAG: MoaD/ThiS family protein [Burkholderiales bacterium]|nr:MoaD/ThiS family protein [Burkholderiales bacterium]MDE1926505.1 MoaD/ThiS family protein [Burkholderiales bacterium]MDE2160419.1 MoaD/ThiS family protein [Burkholderiales bacterium]MDE2502636.1 MoaD/ThiS family protein [Burkholderiales bacterium]